MDLLLLKICCALVIFFVAAMSGVLPLWHGRRDPAQQLFAFTEAFAGGVFLGAGLIHLLPDAIVNFHQAMPQYEYPIVFALASFTVAFLYFVEHGVVSGFEKSNMHTGTWVAYLLTILLSVHSIVAGAALGAGRTVGHLMLLLFAILSHKGVAAFALGVSLHKSQISFRRGLSLILVFALMTPLGILLGSGAATLLHESPGHVAIGLFDAVAAGTFLYVAGFENDNYLSEGARPMRANTLFRSSTFLLGVLVMAILAVWL